MKRFKWPVCVACIAYCAIVFIAVVVMAIIGVLENKSEPYFRYSTAAIISAFPFYIGFIVFFGEFYERMVESK